MNRTTTLVFFLILVTGCDVSNKNSSHAQVQACSAAEAHLEKFLSENRSCNTDSDCNADYGGCITLKYNNSTDRSELYRFKMLYDVACDDGVPSYCGMPPGTPACVDHVCTSFID